jgi:hypothetical protein
VDFFNVGKVQDFIKFTTRNNVTRCNCEEVSFLYQGYDVAAYLLHTYFELKSHRTLNHQSHTNTN